MARYFTDGGSNYLRYAGSPVMALPFSVACWFRMISGGGTNDRELWSLGNTTVDTRYHLLRFDGGENAVAIQTRNTNVQQSISATNTITRGVWQHAAGVWVSSTSRTAYANGTAATESTGSGGTFDFGPVAMALGRLERLTPTNYMAGDMAHVGVWAAALEATEIAALAKGVDPRLIRPSALVAYWPLFGTTDPEPDVVGGLGLTVNGATKAEVAPPVLWQRRGRVWAPAVSGVTPPPEGSGTAALTLGASGVGQSLRSGFGVVALTLAVAGAGQVTHAGTGSAGLTLGVEGAGAHIASGTGSTGLTLGVAGTGAHVAAGSGTDALTLGATGVGEHEASGSGVAPLTLGVTGTGDAPTLGVPEGYGVATLTLGVTGVGERASEGTGAATLTLTAIGAGVTTREGSGVATLTLQLVGVGTATHAGSGTATLTLIVTGVGVAGLVDVVDADAAHTWVVGRRGDIWTVPARRDTWRIP